MKQQARTFDIFIMTQTPRLFGYKSTKTLYRLLNKEVLDEYIVESLSGRVFLQPVSKGYIPLADKIRNSFQRKI